MYIAACASVLGAPASEFAHPPNADYYKGVAGALLVLFPLLFVFIGRLISFPFAMKLAVGPKLTSGAYSMGWMLHSIKSVKLTKGHTLEPDEV